MQPNTALDVSRMEKIDVFLISKIKTQTTPTGIRIRRNAVNENGGLTNRGLKNQRLMTGRQNVVVFKRMFPKN